MDMKTKKAWNRMGKGMAAGMMAAALVLAPIGGAPRAEAGWEEVLGGVLGGVSAYDSALMSVLYQGNEASVQETIASDAVKKNKLDLNDGEVALVDRVMNQLLAKGDYVLDGRSLPFRWNVTNSSEFNAYCTYDDYINVYRGLLLELHGNEDELAAVLGHEMTHGLEHHVAHRYAKQMLQQYGAGYFNSTDQLSADLIALGLNYNAAKNFTLPNENEADEGGFYLAASAGFNPGGSAAFQSHTLAMIENQQFHETDTLFNPDDHPKTAHRLEVAAQMLSDYGYDHVTVKNGSEVYIDNKLLLTAAGTDTLLPSEAAYLIAGAIDKGLHDTRMATLWHFHQTADGVDFLTEDPVYGCLKTAVNQNQAGAAFEQLVTNAYALDRQSGRHDELLAKEQERLEEIAKKRDKAKEKMKDEDIRAQAENNADVYNSLGKPELALLMASRLEAADPGNNYVHAIRGNSYAQLGDPTRAIHECNLALAGNAKDPALYVSRARAHHILGEDSAALMDCAAALQLDTQVSGAYRLAAEIYDAQGDHGTARSLYQKLKETGADMSGIPDAYAAELY